LKSEISYRPHPTVSLVDHMGDDYRVLDAARVSTGSKSTSDETRDKKLINHLWTNRHGTPFEKIIFEFHVKCPIFTARQIFRHRIGSFNEMSGRYRILPMNFFLPEIWRSQNKPAPGVNKQGSHIDPALDQEEATAIARTAYVGAVEAYEKLVEMGVANELARAVLPVSVETEFFWTVNFRAAANFLSLRLDPHAQPEIQEVARQMEALIKPLIPWTYEAFETSNRMP